MSLPGMGVQVDRVLRALELQPETFFVGGSGGLALRGIRPIGSDLDIGVTTRMWHDLQAQAVFGRPSWSVYTPDPHDERRRCDPPFLYRDVLGTEVNIFYAWQARDSHEIPANDYNVMFREGIEMVHGWPCVKLGILLAQKGQALNFESIRAKDVRDVQLISEYMLQEQQQWRSFPRADEDHSAA